MNVKLYQLMSGIWIRWIYIDIEYFFTISYLVDLSTGSYISRK